MTTIYLEKVADDPAAVYKENLILWKEFFLVESESVEKWGIVFNELKKYEEMSSKEGYLEDWYNEVSDCYVLHLMKVEIQGIIPSLEGFLNEIKEKAKLFFE